MVPGMWAAEFPADLGTLWNELIVGLKRLLSPVS